MLTTNAKASGRKLTLTIIKDLDQDRQTWMEEVVRKSGLLGQHDTICTKWIPQDQDYLVKITAMVQPAKPQPTVKAEYASSNTSLAGSREATNTSLAGSSGEVKKEKSDLTTGDGFRSAIYPQTPGKTDLTDDDNDADVEDQNTMMLAERLQRMETTLVE